MRVISGTARGRKLLSLDGLHTRPTTDRVKEAIFNMVMPYVRDGAVLDLFAGSGALGIEALSRGAACSTFLENSRAAADVIRQNLENTKLSENAKLIEGDALAFLSKVQGKYTLIFLDPPYDGGFYTPVLSLIAERALLQPDGVLILEKRADMDIPLPCGLEILKERKYGKTTILIIGNERKEIND